MTVKWLGHSCFLITTDAGIRILTDPADPSTGYRIAPVEADIVSVSHAHHDHAYMDIVKGSPVTVKDAGRHSVMGISITGVEVSHDHSDGAHRGKSIAFIFDIDGIRLMHAGDIGCLPDERTLSEMGRVDVLMTPVGGVYTLDGIEACALTDMLRPGVVFPMHYKTADCVLDIADAKAFFTAAKHRAVHRVRDCICTLTKESLGTDRIIDMGYEKSK